MALFGRLAERIKADPSVLLVLLVGPAVLAVPSFASSTWAAISVPGGLDPAFCGALALGVCLCSMARMESLDRTVRAVGLVVGTGFVALELWCLLQRGQIDGWHFLCTRPGLVQAQHAVRLVSGLALIRSCAGDAPGDWRAAPGGVVSAGLLLLAGAALLVVAASGFTRLAYALMVPDVASVTEGVVAYVCYALMLLGVLACGSRAACWVLVSSHCAGSVMASALLDVCDNLLNMPLSLDVSGTIVCCLGAVALPAAALARLSGALMDGHDPSPEMAQDDGEELGKGPVCPEGVLVTALERLEGAEALSGREREVILLDLSGESSDDMAGRLSVSRASIGTYRSRAYHKLGLSGRQELLGLLLGQAEIEAQAPSGEVSGVRGRASVLRTALLPALIACAALGLSHVVPTGAVTFVSAPVLSVVVVAALANLFDRPARWRELSFAQLPDLLATAALTGGALVLLTSGDLAGRVICGASAVLAWCALARERRIEGVWASLCAGSGAVFGLVVVTIASAVDPGETVLVPCVCALAVSALMTLYAALGRERAVLADCSLRGRERARAYLMGRGLTELEADVSVLTALGFSCASIAVSLCISPHTASTYRARSYERLGVSGRGELRDLLRREAGFR